MHAGTFSVCVEQMRPPQDQLRVLDVKQWYVDHLVDMISEEDDDHEDLTAPMLVIASVPKKVFKERSAEKYTHQVIGVIQCFSSILKLNERKDGI